MSPLRRHLLAPLLAGLAACAPLRRAPEPRETADRAGPAPGAPTAPDRVRSGAGPPAGPWQVLAHSVQQRPIRMRTLGQGPRRVLFIGGIHGDEPEGSWTTEALAEAFLAEPGAAGAVTLILIEDLNPDGRAAGRRTNANGIDLNRDFPAANFRPGGAGRPHGAEPLSQPESRALHELLLEFAPELVLVAHSWRGASFVNYDGPARELAEAFSSRSGLPLRESSRLAPTPGSLGSWVGVQVGVPILTLEYLRGQSPESAWETTRTALLAAILGG